MCVQERAAAKADLDKRLEESGLASASQLEQATKKLSEVGDASMAQLIEVPRMMRRAASCRQRRTSAHGEGLDFCMNLCC